VIPKNLKTAWIAGCRLKFEIVHGEVIESKTWSETNIQSTSQKSRRTNAQWLTGISSTETEITELYIRTPEGRETSARLYNSTAGVRTGNTIALLFANDTVIGLWNKEQELYWSFNVNWIIKEQYTASEASFIKFLVWIAIIGCIALFFNAGVGFWIIGVCIALIATIGVLKVIGVKIRKKRLKKRVKNIFDVVSQSCS